MKGIKYLIAEKNQNNNDTFNVQKVYLRWAMLRVI